MSSGDYVVDHLSDRYRGFQFRHMLLESAAAALADVRDRLPLWAFKRRWRVGGKLASAQREKLDVEGRMDRITRTLSTISAEARS